MANTNYLSKTLWRHPGFRIAALGVALTLGSLATASAGKPGSCTNASLTASIGDVDSQGLAADIASDGLGAYHDNVDGVTSILTCNGYNGIKLGDWQFNSYNSTTRNVSYSFDADDAVQPGDPHYQAPANPPFWGPQLHLTHMEVKCTAIHNDMLTMAAGDSFTCPLLTSFLWDANTYYGLHPALSFTGFPETTDVQIYCNTADSGGCNDWFLDPIGLGEAVGRLVKHVTIHNKDVTTDDGDFYMRFHVHLTRP